jgi:hypothetical protein
MLYAETQMSIVLQYQRACSALCTAAASAREALMQLRCNREKERQKYYALLQLAQGGHPPPCCITVRYRKSNGLSCPTREKLQHGPPPEHGTEPPDGLSLMVS